MALSVCNSTTDFQQKELLEYGDAAFPIACFEDDLNCLNVPWHWHNEWEFIFVEKGTATVLLENAQLQIAAGDGLFINACALHAIDSHLSRGAVLHSAVFHPRLIGANVESVFWNQLVLPLSLDTAPGYVVLNRRNPVHRQMLEDFQGAWAAVAAESEDWENLTRYLLSKVWRSLCGCCIDKSVVLPARHRVDGERIRAMLTYIDENLPGELNARRISESVNVSQSVCLRCFRKMLGTTPMQYVQQVRLDKAAEMLRSTAMTAKEIALACGFHDVSYFTKAFREKNGCTPKQFRNKGEK